MTEKPTKFVGLHAHSAKSIGDGLGKPKEHIDFAIENGADALALTDHGNMNGMAEQLFHWENLKKKGVKFKAIPGIEAYYVDSLSDWQKMYHEAKAAGTLSNQKKPKKKSDDEIIAEAIADIGDDSANTRKEAEEMYGKVDDEASAQMENEEESKNHKKFFNPVNQRNHLVLLPKNKEGLKTLFKIVSESYKDGFYKYPRVDLDMLRKYANGNLIASTACIAGNLSSIIAMNQADDFDFKGEYNPRDLTYNFDLIQQQLIKKIHLFQEALGEENFNLELQFNKIPLQHIINYHLIEASKKTTAPLIVTCDSHYARPELWREREIYKAMIWAGKTKGNFAADSLPKTIDELKCELYPKNAEQVWDSYKSFENTYNFYNDKTVKDAIERTWDIANNQISDNVLDLDKSVKLPGLQKVASATEISTASTKIIARKKKNLEKFKTTEPTEDELQFEILKQHAIDGLIKRGFGGNKVYVDRLATELETVKFLKITSYFLTYEKIMNLVSSQMLTGAGRGSAAGSLLAYVLNITQVDPIRFGLLFERFLSKKKFGFPDIDSDSSDRELALKIITEYFGEDSVIAISTFGQLQMKSLIRDLGRLYDVPLDVIGEVTMAVEKESRGEAKKREDFDNTTWTLTYDEAKQNSPTFNSFIEQYPQIEKSIQVLFKNPRSLGRHAGGVLISDNITDNMPVIKSGNVMQTPWTEGLNEHQLEPLGFLKFDILAVGTLRMVENTIRKIVSKKCNKQEHEVEFSEINEWFYQNLHPDNNMMDDQKVYEYVYHKGNWGGIFQFAQPPVRRFVMDLRPRSIDDLSAATSIFRPGPLSAQVDKTYLQQRAAPELITYRHPMLAEILDKESGCILYQESLQLIYHKLAGMPLDETDMVRKAFTKKDKSNIEKTKQDREKLKADFIVKCKAANGIDEKTSQDIFEDMEKYVSYCFNKSHAVSYSILSYQSAWLMTYHQNEWVTSYIDYSATEKGKLTGKEDPKSVAINESIKLGFKLGKSDINWSELNYSIRQEKDSNILTPSFMSMKGIGKAAAEEIMEIRKTEPYTDIYSLFLTKEGKWKHSKFNKSALGSLIKTEALESTDLVGKDKLFKNYKQLYNVAIENFDTIKNYHKRKTVKLADVYKKIDELVAESQSIQDWTGEEKKEFQIEIIGQYDIGSTYDPQIFEELEKQGIISIDEFNESAIKKPTLCWFFIKKANMAKTKAGKPYIRVDAQGPEHNKISLFCWNAAITDKAMPVEGDIAVCTLKKWDGGMQTNDNIANSVVNRKVSFF